MMAHLVPTDRSCRLVGAFAAAATISSACSMITTTVVRRLMWADTLAASVVVAVGTTVSAWDLRAAGTGHQSAVRPPGRLAAGRLAPTRHFRPSSATCTSQSSSQLTRPVDSSIHMVPDDIHRATAHAAGRAARFHNGATAGRR
jgi:hypothetical protein